jgi:hypothetical protein
MVPTGDVLLCSSIISGSGTGRDVATEASLREEKITIKFKLLSAHPTFFLYSFLHTFFSLDYDVMFQLAARKQADSAKILTTDLNANIQVCLKTSFRLLRCQFHENPWQEDSFV